MIKTINKLRMNRSTALCLILACGLIFILAVDCAEKSEHYKKF